MSDRMALAHADSASRRAAKLGVPVRSAYLAGPMRNLPRYNFDAFDAAAYALRQDGWTVQSPAEHDRSMGFDPAGSLEGFDLSAAMAWDLQQVLDTDCIIILPGWERSTGCHYELSVCHALGKPVFQYPEMTPVVLPRVVTDPVGAPGAYANAAVDGYEEGLAFMRGVDGPGAYIREHAFGVRVKRPDAFDKALIWDDIAGGKLGEVRVVDPQTGGAKGSKPAQLGALDPGSLLRVAEVAGFGGAKYDRYNFLKGYRWSLSFDALQRHLLAYWGGQDNDEESGLPHLAHAAWHCLALTAFMDRELGTDDRPV